MYTKILLCYDGSREGRLALLKMEDRGDCTVCY